MDAATLEHLRARLVLASAYTDNDQGGRDPHARERRTKYPNGWNSKHSGDSFPRVLGGDSW